MITDANLTASVATAQLQPLFPPTVVLRSASVRDHFASLAESEQSCVTHAVQSRRAEFSTGRVLAADGLRELGVGAFPLERGSHNEPLWPPGIVGSISHSSGVCVVAMARTQDMKFIGIDVESSTADVTKISELILTASEYRYDAKFESVTLADRTRITFCAKEAIFKAVYPLVARFVDFREVALEIDADTQTFVAQACNDGHLDRILKSGIGRFTIADSVLISSFFCEAPHPGSTEGRRGRSAR
jgi:4'-phosphopantetheinyl transferase EntD